MTVAMKLETLFSQVISHIQFIFSSPLSLSITLLIFFTPISYKFYPRRLLASNLLDCLHGLFDCFVFLVLNGFLFQLLFP